MNLQQLTEDAFTNAVAKGWHDKPTTFMELLALIHSEVDEAVIEDVKRGIYYVNNNPKPEGYQTEIADVCIRIFNMCGKFNIELCQTENLIKTDKTVNEVCRCAHMFISDIIEHYRAGCVPNGDIITSDLNLLIAFLIDNVDGLENAINVKMEYNKLREYRHGGKRI